MIFGDGYRSMISSALVTVSRLPSTFCLKGRSLERLMSDIVAKVAQAFVDCGLTEKTKAVEYARAAIKAMREPTEAMLEAAGDCEVTVATFEYNYEGYVSEKEAAAVWSAMIDAALK
jgi:hypothetical protein